MKNIFTYPFYKSLRFRFGLLFGLVFLIFLSVIACIIYLRTASFLSASFENESKTLAQSVLDRTGVSPLAVPVPRSREYYRIIYDTGIQQDTLFDNIETLLKNPRTNEYRLFRRSVKTETGATLSVLFFADADSYNSALRKLQQLLFIGLPFLLIISLITGYLISGYLLRPVSNIISKTNSVNLSDNIKLLDVPAAEDELHRLTIAVNRMLQRIQVQSAEQQAFFISASHELRTPLSNMLTQLEVSRNTSVNKHATEILNDQLTEVKRLTRIVNDFLTMGQLRSSNIHLQLAVTDIVALTVETAEKLAINFTDNNLSLQISIVPESGFFVTKADTAQLSSIIYNLLHNASKYAAENTIVRLDISKEHDQINWKLTNSKKAALKSLQKENSLYRRSDHPESYGLGLWIAEKLLELHHSNLKVEQTELDFTAGFFLEELSPET